MGERRLWGRVGAVALILGAAVIGAFQQALSAITVLTGQVVTNLDGGDSRLPITSLPLLTVAKRRDGIDGYADEADFAIRVVSSLPSIVLGVITLAAAIFLARVVSEIFEGRPFQEQAMKAWFQLSAVLLVGGAVALAIEAAVFAYMAVQLSPAPGQRSPLGAEYAAVELSAPEWSIGVVLAGVVAIVMQIAFRAAARHEREADGVI